VGKTERRKKGAEFTSMNVKKNENGKPPWGGHYGSAKTAKKTLQGMNAKAAG